MIRTIGCFMAVTSAAAVAAAFPSFNVYVEHGGVYQITWERLHDAGLEGEPASSQVAVTNLGEPVPVIVEDGGDGRFGPGDHLELVAGPLRGDHSYLDEYSRFNCYRVRFDVDGAARGAANPVRIADPAAPPTPLQAWRHLEQDQLMVRFRESPEHEEERWYWSRLSVADAAPAVVPVSLGGAVGGPVRVRVGARGWSEPRHREVGSISDHRVEVRLGDRLLGASEWDGTGHHAFELEVPAELATGPALDLAFRVPRRTFPESGEGLIDVVLLNWLEIAYAASAEPVGGQAELRIAAEVSEAIVPGSGAGAIRFYTAAGTRVDAPAGTPAVVLEAPADRRILVVAEGGLREPDEVVLDRPSSLRAPAASADYLMITHRSLAGALEPLAELHRGRGLAVEIVDVQDVYDEFNHGILHPRALHDFLSWAYHEWPRPAPRFVLLVGDASWDAKNTEADDRRYADWTFRSGEWTWFAKNGSTPYAGGRLPNDRNLVPTWSYPTYEGHAASDNWLACVDGDDDLPDFAIGRIPVATPEELAQVVAKTVAYATAPELGEWRRELLFITNESAGFQRSSDRAAELFAKRGYVSHKIYPDPSEPANEHHTRQILERMDAGVRIVQFLGHGGRYIWRTGPPDLKKNHDLFTLEQLDELAPTPGLPVVLSLTCYSAPFDHPTADSIGEKLLRIADRGAIAVVAASWRNSPSSTMGEILIEELSVPATTIGEAVQRAKAKIRSPMLVQTYNLLGDPAAPMVVPSGALELVSGGNDAAGAVEIRSETLGTGASALVEWLDADGGVVATREVALDGSRTRVEMPGGVRVSPSGVRVYAWDAGQGRDATAWLDLTEDAGSRSAQADSARSHEELS